MPVPKQIKELVEKFHRNIEAYKSLTYNEAQVRQEFINPMFRALGWDMENTQGFAEAYKDVIHEDSIKISGVTKAPDYCFRIGGTRKFFLEAKKPAINLNEATDAAYQLKRYAWSANLPLSILTDFEEFAVYDCRIKPFSNDKPSKARILYLRYTDLIDKWDEIASVFSRDEILRGSFDKFVETSSRKRGTAQVDNAFLEEIESWREMFARNIALRNPELSQRELNYCVQITIDRIIFLRICEDRGIEHYGQLQALQNGTRIYARLLEQFDNADQRYNSGLFYFTQERGRPGSPDSLTPKIEIDDKPIKDIIKRLYYPDSPYEFSVLPADILGQVYEQFLGKVIRLTAGHQAKVEEKPEVRKAGGVYYTPKYIVDYIVQNTIGTLLEDKTPGPRGTAGKLTILDPACGSGSFLIGAYQYLLDWHLGQYLADNPDKWARGENPVIAHNRRGQWQLTTNERKRILLANIYGVDIDSQAVEVTKLSLMLKVLEGEDAETINLNFANYHQRALPDLGGNIKCGNSLIEPDYFVNKNGDLFDENRIYRINAFNWHTEFSGIMNKGGFGAVIGNPPYGAIFQKDEIEYINNKTSVFKHIQDAYIAFIEKGHALLRAGGRFGYIIPSAWLGGPKYSPLRMKILESKIDNIIMLPFDVFRDAYIDTLIIITSKEIPDEHHIILTYEYPKKARINNITEIEYNKVAQSIWFKTPDYKFVTDANMLLLLMELGKRINGSFGDVIRMKRGVLFDEKDLTDKKTSEYSFRYFEGDVYRYFIKYKASRWIEYGSKMKEYPKDLEWFYEDRILLRRLVNRQSRLMASLISRPVVTNKNLYILKATNDYTLEYILSILNSKLISKLYLSQVSQATKDDFPQISIQDILKLPFPKIDLGNSKIKNIYKKLNTSVARIIELKEKAQLSKTSSEKDTLNRQIEALERDIDSIVYSIYGLTPEEISIIEE
jgi:type I restriction-modification system DNA methylase subunit